MRRWTEMLCLTVALFCSTQVCYGEDGAKPADDSFKREHFAFSGGFDYLDGPRREAMLTREGRYLSSDPDGNWYIMWKFSTSWLRVIRVDGMVETIMGDNHWTPHSELAEGPAAYFPNMGYMPVACDLYVPGYGIQVSGYPLKGEESGCIYVFFRANLPYKIYKNKEKDDRWWFKRLGKPGGTKLPVAKGESTVLSETDLYEVAFSGDDLILHKGSLYEISEADDKITCILALSDYKSRFEAAANAPEDKKGAGSPSHAARADDGTIYLAYYFRGFSRRIFRISADQSEMELIVHHDQTQKGGNIDGIGTRTGWHCGPSKVMIAGKNTPVLFSVDSGSVRRWKDGRVSVLCYDGEWREFQKGIKIKDVRCKVYQPAGFGVPYINIHYPGEEMGGDFRGYRVGPVDFEKPTVGSLVKNEAPAEVTGESK